MSCDAVRNLLQDYLTRDLPPAQRSMVDAHLLECDRCRQEMALMSVVVSGLSTQPVLEPSAGFTQRVVANLPARPKWVLSPWWSLALAPVLAGLAYLWRKPLLGGLLEVAGWFGVDPAQLGSARLPDISGVSPGQLGLYTLFGTVLFLGVFSLGVALCWKWYAEGR
jgi:hypothetical protein